MTFSNWQVICKPDQKNHEDDTRYSALVHPVYTVLAHCIDAHLFLASPLAAIATVSYRWIFARANF